MTTTIRRDMFFLDKVMQETSGTEITDRALLILALQYIRYLGEEHDIDTEEGFLAKLRSLQLFS